MKVKKIIVITILMITMLATFFALGMGAYAFSDEYEPYYPHITAVTRSVEDIYKRVSSATKVLPDEVVKSRKEMIQMYKDVGIDVSLEMEDYLVPDKLVGDIPQRWSTQTPIPLGESPDYSGAFSIDACWNNKIPEEAPRVYVPPAGLTPKISLGVIQAEVDPGGWGTGVPQIVSTPSDPFITIAAKYSTGNINKILRVHAPEGFRRYINNGQHGDEHIVFIDGETMTGVQTWASRCQGDPRGYKLGTWGCLPGYDVRCGAASVEFRLDGIGSEGQVGVFTVNTPANAFTLKSSEVSSTTELFNHAMGAAIGQMVGGRVYPAISNDPHMDMEPDGTGSNGQYNTGVVPYGGIVQFDPEFDLEKLYYTDKKISFHAYRILKCMQEYGMYNLDCSGAEFQLLYTSTYSNDWKNPDFEGFNVPYKNNEQGFDRVCEEINALLMSDWEWFGLSEQPKLFVTVPVVKYADLDVNDDGVIDIIDHDLVMEHIGQAYSDDNKQFDVNQDKELNGSDVEIMYNYLNDLPIHSFTWHDVSYVDNDEVHGRIVITATGRTSEGRPQYRDGTTVSFGAAPENGWEFAGWTGDFAKYGDQPVVKIEIDRSLNIGAKYKKKPEVDLTVKVSGPGHIEASENAIVYGTPKDTYGIDTLVSFKAVADDGYEFLGWAGDATGFSTTLDIVLDKDKEIIALFGEKGYTETFASDNWILVSGDENACDINEGVSFTTNTNGFKQGKIVYGRKEPKGEFDISGDFSIRANISFKNLLDGNHGKILFNYKNDANYYYVAVGGEGYFEFGKLYKGVSTVLKKIEGAKSVVNNGVIFLPPLDIEIIKKGSYIYVNGYKDGEKYEYCKVRDKSLKGGSIGVGSTYNGALKISNIIISNTISDASNAKEQTWVTYGENTPWFKKLDGAVVVAADSEKAYANNKATTISSDGSVKPYFAEDGVTIYVPVRYVTESLGGKVVYDPATDSVIATYGEHSGTFKAWTDGAQEINGTLYVTAEKLSEALGKELYVYKRAVFFSDTVGVYTPESEPECQEFIKTIFDIKYYM